LAKLRTAGHGQRDSIHTPRPIKMTPPMTRLNVAYRVSMIVGKRGEPEYDDELAEQKNSTALTVKAREITRTRLPTPIGRSPHREPIVRSRPTFYVPTSHMITPRFNART
jgi:hypothetical protein